MQKEAVIKDTITEEEMVYKSIYETVNQNRAMQDEIENKNTMLRDQILHEQGIPTVISKEYLITLESNQIKNIVDKESKKGVQNRIAGDLKYKKTDLTEICLEIVKSVLNLLVVETELIPYTIRAMLKIILL